MRQKLIRRSILKDYQTVFDTPKDMKGKWHEHFENDSPITIELGCGKADFSYQIAKTHPFRNFIAVDKKSDRIYVGATKALEEEIRNIAFVRGLIDSADDYFATEEVDEIWITFPDPHPKKAKAKHRLTHPRFIEMYKKFLRPGGLIHLKTDFEPLLDYTLEVIGEMGFQIEDLVKNIYGQVEVDPILHMQTDYERKHIADGREIHYVSFRI